MGEVMEAVPLKTAIISDDGVYRYALSRDTGVGKDVVAFIGVNPSTADAHQDDATIRKLYGFGARNNIRKWVVGNLFAYRATDVRGLKTATDPEGPEADAHLANIFRQCDYAVFGWGSLAKLPRHLRFRWALVRDIALMADCATYCIGTTKDGQPKHPLMTPYCTPITRWEPQP
jgi:hypothetical protein